MKTLEKKFTVKEENTAIVVGSGSLEVLGTPVMIAWMENTAANIANELCQEGETSVGIMINTTHLKASAIGEEITCKATLTAQDGRKLSYKIECKNQKDEVIGTSTHDRFIVNAEKFMSKL